MTVDLIAAFERAFGPQPVRDYEWDGAPEGPDHDLFVSDNEAAYRQQRYDNWLEGGAA